MQEEVRRYGFRPSKTRKLLIEQLSQVEEALNKQEQQQKQSQEVGDLSIASSSSSFLCHSMDLTASDDEPMSDFTFNVVRQARESKEGEEQQNSRRSSLDVGDGDEDDDEVVDLSQGESDENVAASQSNAATTTSSPNDIAPSLSNQLYKAITSNKALYHRILLFEPVSFDEVSSTAKRAGVVGLKSKETLRNWLDMQGICFYSAELTGQRQRY